MVLDNYNLGGLHISTTDMKSWTTTTPPYDYSSLTTYQSKFVLVGGYDRSTHQLTSHLWTSTTGFDWKTSLPSMPTSRSNTSSVSGGSPEVLVVAGGCGLNGKILDVVEVLLGDHWITAESLPNPCRNMRSTFHEMNLYFTGGEYKRKILFKCSLESLIVSASKDRTTPLAQSIWEMITTSIYTYAIASYLSNLIGMDRYSTIRIYSDWTRVWIESTSEGDVPHQTGTGWISTAVLSAKQLVIANGDGIYRGTLSG